MCWCSVLSLESAAGGVPDKEDIGLLAACSLGALALAAPCAGDRHHLMHQSLAGSAVPF